MGLPVSLLELGLSLKGVLVMEPRASPCPGLRASPLQPDHRILRTRGRNPHPCVTEQGAGLRGSGRHREPNLGFQPRAAGSQSPRLSATAFSWDRNQLCNPGVAWTVAAAALSFPSSLASLLKAVVLELCMHHDQLVALPRRRWLG